MTDLPPKEFGHVGRVCAGFALDTWGSGPFLLTVGGKTFRFEDSDRFGPQLVTKRGDICATQPDERSLFWRAHRQWVKQGRKTGDDGTSCLFDPGATRPTKYSWVNGAAVIVEHGDDDGGFEEVPTP